MSVKDIYLIKDLSHLTGLSGYTIKYYIKLGLIKEFGRGVGTNFRYFDNSALEALRKIISLKEKGLSLADIALTLKSQGGGV